jgi:hypothetical protein
MANVIVNLGNTPINISGNSDLATFAEQQLPNIVFNIAQSDIVKFSNKPLSDVPSDSNNPATASLKVTQDAKWKVGGSGDLTIGFSASAEGSVQIVKAGDLFSYSVSNNKDEDVKISVPDGSAYVVINLKVSLGLKAGASFSHGTLGVQGGIDSSVTFNLTNYKCFPLTTQVDAAVKDAFNRFVLPFKAAGFETALKNNDYVEYEFIGKLGLTFGVTYGLTSLFLGGRSLGEIEKSFDSSAGKIVVGVKPSFEAGAKFGIDYEYADAFRVVVGRLTDAQSKSDKLTHFLSKMDTSKLAISVSVGITVSLNASFSLESNLDEIIDKAAKSLFKNMPDGSLKDAAIQAFKDNLNKEEHKRELDQYIKEANDQVNKLLKNLDGQKLELQVLHESIDTHTALYNYEFDLKVPEAINQGFDLAMAGNFTEALRVKGVSLLPSSYIEDEFIRRTTIILQLFDLFHFVSITEYFRKMSLVYAGKGVFKMRFTTGVKYDDGFVGHDRSVELFFTADAATTDFQNVAGLDVKLNFVLADHANRRSARQTLGIMQYLGSSADLQSLAARLRDTLESDASLNVKLSCAFDKRAYGRLTSDDFDQHNKPHQLPQPFDQANWNAFVKAVDDVSVGGGYKGEGFPDFVSRFGDWVRYNRVANDSQTSTQPPDRRSSGNSNTDSLWPDEFRQRDSLSDRRLMLVYLEAGRGFMNLVDDLKHLATDQTNVNTEDQYKDLLKFLNSMVKNGQSNDVQVWFIKPALLALLRLINGNVMNVKGPAQDEKIGDTFEVSFDILG